MAEVSRDNHARPSSLSAIVLKAMSLFGGLQVAQIICSVIRIKLVAVWIGPAGVGLFGIYNSAVEMISTISQLGVRNSAVRDVVGATQARIAVIMTVVRRWSWFLGALGAVATIAFSPLLSRLTFGDENHTGGFVLLSVVMFLTSALGGEQAIMQGTKHLRRLAVSSLWGAMGGLVISIPMYYWWRLDSIVPSIIAYAAVGFVAAMFYRVPRSVPAQKVSVAETIETGKGFISLGFYMTLSLFLCMLASYLFVSYLNTRSDTAEVGYYQAGYTLFNRYVGLIFTAIAMEFYPRLTSVHQSRARSSLFVSHELVIVLWLLIPVISLFVTAAKPIVLLLYSSDFEVIVPFACWGIVGTVLRAVSWCMAMIILAKGDGRVFMLTEGISAVACLSLNVLCYHLGGLTGLGISYIAWYAVYTAIVAIVYFRRYRLSLTRQSVLLTASAIIVTTAATLSALYVGWLPAAIITAAATAVSYRHLRPLLYHRKLK